MPTAQFNDKQKRISSRLDRFENISKLLSSTKKADRQQAQRKLKSLGRYNGPIDGAQGKGTTAALKAMRNKIDADQIRLDKNINNFNKVEAGKRKSAALKRADAGKKRADAAKEQARKDKNAMIQTGFQAGTIVTSGGVTAYQVNKLNKLDKPAVAARNKELARFTKEIDKIKAEPGAKTKTKALKAVTKRRIGAVAEQASKAGLTKYRGPIGAPSGSLLAMKGGLLMYAASQTENELLKGALNATGGGLILAGAGTPAYRITQNAFGKNQLNGQHLAKIADAKALAAPKTKTAPKTLKSTAVTGAKAVGRKALKAVPAIGWGLAAYAIGEAAYSKFSKTGSAAKAATAGAEVGVDVLTSGAYSVTKKQAKSFYKQSPNVLVNKGVTGYAKHYAPHNVVLRTALSFIPAKHLPANGKKVLNDAKAAVKAPTRKVKSVGALLKSSTAKSKSPVLKSSFRKAKSISSNGRVKAHTRTINGKRVRVKGFKRKAVR